MPTAGTRPSPRSPTPFDRPAPKQRLLGRGTRAGLSESLTVFVCRTKKKTQ